MSNKPFIYQAPFPMGKDNTEYYLLTSDYVSVADFDGETILKVEPEALTLLAQQAFHDASFMLRPAHQKQVAAILHDPEASENDKYVALQFLRNSEIAAKGVLPTCQDTGTAIIVGKKGQRVWTGGGDEEALSKGVYNTYIEDNLRYSQNAALDMYKEVNTGTNLPAFGGKYFAHDIRVIRLPRHGASCPVGMGVSCSADRNIKAKINREGIWIEKLEHNPGQYIPQELRQAGEGEAVKVDLNRPMKEILAQLSQYPVSTRLSLTGTIIVGRDIAHAKLKELIDAGKELPQYIKDHPIYYAGPAKTPAGYPSGSLGPTTAGRMDSYVDLLQSHGGSMIMLAKGNRSQQVTDACHKHGGFYLGSIGGPAAVLAQQSIKHLECVAYPELGMEAIWKIEVEDFPAFILVDDKGNDFFQQIVNKQCANCTK